MAKDPEPADEAFPAFMTNQQDQIKPEDAWLGLGHPPSAQNLDLRADEPSFWDIPDVSLTTPFAFNVHTTFADFDHHAGGGFSLGDDHVVHQHPFDHSDGFLPMVRSDDSMAMHFNASDVGLFDSFGSIPASPRILVDRFKSSGTGPKKQKGPMWELGGSDTSDDEEQSVDDERHMDPIIEEPPITTTGAKNRKRLPQRAKSILEDAFRVEPYPDAVEVKSLATKAAITVEQVRNWFGNKRSRTNQSRSSSRESNLTHKSLEMLDDGTQSDLSRLSSAKGPPSVALSTVSHQSTTMSAFSRSSRGPRRGRRRWTKRHDPTATPSNRKLQAPPGEKEHAGKKKSKPDVKYHCTFCGLELATKFAWKRHEETSHLQLARWLCTMCLGEDDPEKRTFYRKDHMTQHLRLVHKLEARGDDANRLIDGMALSADQPAHAAMRYCRSCDLSFETWDARVDHIAKHFREKVSFRCPDRDCERSDFCKGFEMYHLLEEHWTRCHTSETS